MNSNFKKTFFSSLLAVLLIISNLIGIKYTNFGDLILSVNFIVFPFMFLCILLINNLSNKKEASSAIISSVFIQVFILLTYVLTTNLGSQNIIPDFANSVNSVFLIDETYMMANLIAFMLCSHILQYIEGYFSGVGYKLLGVFVSLLMAIILYGLVTIPIINYGFGLDIILKMIMCHLLMSVIMAILVTTLYYLLKEDEYVDSSKKKFIQEQPVSLNKDEKKEDKVVKSTVKKNSSKTSTTKKNSSKTNTSKKVTSTKKKETNKKDSSKKNVKK